MERWTGDGLTKVAVDQDVLTSRLLPRFRLELRRLFARPAWLID